MNDSMPTPREARAALAAATRHAGRIHRTDKQFRPILFGIAAMYLACGLLVGLFSQRGSPTAGILVVVIVLGGLAAGLTLIWKIRVYSRAGILRFVGAVAAFSIWNAAVIGVSTASGWWGYHQLGVHFTVSAFVACLPLLIAAWLVGRKQG